jgi:hypothetical protein
VDTSFPSAYQIMPSWHSRNSIRKHHLAHQISYIVLE